MLFTQISLPLLIIFIVKKWWIFNDKKKQISLFNAHFFKLILLKHYFGQLVLIFYTTDSTEVAAGFFLNREDIKK